MRSEGARHGVASERAWIAAGMLLVLAPFAGAAFAIDAPVFLAVARRILAAPLDPFGFQMAWDATALDVARFNLNQMVIVPLLANLSVLLIFIVTAITMRMFPEEKRAGTYELVATSELLRGLDLGLLATFVRSGENHTALVKSYRHAVRT